MAAVRPVAAESELVMLLPAFKMHEDELEIDVKLVENFVAVRSTSLARLDPAETDAVLILATRRWLAEILEDG